jgi:serine protease AprX
VQKNLLQVLLAKGDTALHEAVQQVWPLDAEAAFGVLPTRLRLRADPRFSGRGITIAVVDSGFYPHADLIQPQNRIRAWADATQETVAVIRFGKTGHPEWPDWDGARDWQWHGTMTSVVAGGNGFLSRGLYSSLAHDAEVVLVQVRDRSGAISSDSIARALGWIRENAKEFGIRIVSLSVSGDPVWPLSGNLVDEAVASLVEDGINVIAAAGNDGERKLLPPATAPFACTVGGIDDKNTFSDEDVMLWHSNYGNASNGVPKPEVVAPSIWVAAPVLPSSKTAEEAKLLFERRGQGDTDIEDRLSELKLITPHYQHVDGTSFAAPLVASTVACMLEANPALSPFLIRSILMETAHRVPGAEPARQGAGAIAPGQAVARALAERHGKIAAGTSPDISASGIVFSLHDHNASRVEVFGSWNAWKGTSLAARLVEPGFWQTRAAELPQGRHTYKFLLDDERWLDDPANPKKAPDGLGGLNSVVYLLAPR